MSTSRTNGILLQNCLGTFDIRRNAKFRAGRDVGQEMTSPHGGTFIFCPLFTQQRYFGLLLLMTKSFGSLRGREGRGRLSGRNRKAKKQLRSAHGDFSTQKMPPQTLRHLTVPAFYNGFTIQIPFQRLFVPSRVGSLTHSSRASDRLATPESPEHGQRGRCEGAVCVSSLRE